MHSLMRMAGLSLFALWLPLISIPAIAACVDNGAGTFTCDGSSTNNSQQTGKTILDNSSGAVILNNTSLPDSGGQFDPDRVTIINDYTRPNTGPISTIEVTGGNNPVTINNTGFIEMLRGVRSSSGITPVNPTTISFTATQGGALMNNGVAAGMDAAIYADDTTSLLTINNLRGDAYGQITAAGRLSAAIFGSAREIVINNLWQIGNSTAETSPTTANINGAWAIATFGGASYVPPGLQDGTQAATVISTGRTEINNASDLTATIAGDVYVVDRNPLLELAQRRNPALVLAYGPQDVGPRDSLINGRINGNLYLGSGAHVLNGTATNIYVDQKAADVVEVNGGVASVLYSVAGARTFTWNHIEEDQNSMGNLYINDVVGAVNTVNVLAGQDGHDNVDFDYITNGLGNNTLNLNCLQSRKCSAGGNWTGLKAASFIGDEWKVNEGSNISLASGDVNITSRRFVLGGNLGADNIIINSGSSLLSIQNLENILQPPRTDDSIGSLSGNVINNGTISLRNAELTINGNVVFNAGSTLDIRITGDNNGMVDVVGGTGNFSSGSILNVASRGRFYRTGDTFTVATNSSGAPIIREDLGIINFTSSIVGGDLILTARVGIPDFFNTTVAGNNAVMALMNYAGSNAAILGLASDIQELSNRELQRAAERLRPEINDSSLRMVMSHTDNVQGLVQSHLFDMHLASIKGEPSEPVNGKEGKLPSGSGVWFQGFGSSGTQDKLNNVDGYKLSSTGMAAGIDRMIGNSDSLRLGAAGAYAYGNVDNSGITDNNRNNITSKIGMLYGSWAPDVWYLNGAMGLALHNYETDRVALGYSNDSKHSSRQYSARVDAGWPLLWNDLVTFVPQASLSYNRINEDAYRETGSQVLAEGTPMGGVLNETTVISPTLLSIQSKTYDSLRAGLGGKLLFSFQQPDYNAGLELRANYVHEFNDLSNNSYASFIADNVSFYSPGQKADRDAVLLGSSVRLTGNDGKDQLTLLTSYDAQLRDKYFGQVFSLMLRYDFDQGPSYLKKAAYLKAAALAKQESAIAVDASKRDINTLSTAMSGSPGANNPVMQLVEDDLKSTDAQVRENARKKLAVLQAIDVWITAISNNTVQSYLSSYSADYVNEDGLSRRQWENKRRLEMKDGGKPRLKVSDIQVETLGNKAVTLFTQALANDSGTETIQKIVKLEERNGRWLIVSEDSIPLQQVASK